MTPLSLRQTQRPEPPVPGRGGMDMRSTRVRNADTASRLGKRAAKARVKASRLTGAMLATPAYDGTTDPAMMTSRRERRAIAKRNRNT